MEEDLRPISQTPVLAKELEYLVCQWIMTMVGDQLDRSTVHALVDLLHNWSDATDSSNGQSHLIGLQQGL